MSDMRLTGTEKRALILWIIAGIIGIVFAQRYFFQAFPEASVDFKVTRQEALNRAEAFLKSVGENPQGYESTAVFEVDEAPKTYLERELGLKQANQMMASSVNLWYWNVRFFRPEQEEEFLVRISPSGEVAGYDHKIEEARAGAKTLSQEQALGIAQDYLQQKLKMDMGQWEYLPEEANSEAKPNREDWSFTWERKGFKAKDATYRLTASVQGDQIGGSQEYLRVPEQWTRDYRRLRSSNELYGQIALVPYGFLLGGSLWLGISLWRQGKTRWAPAFKIGGIVAILFFLMQVNQWDGLRAGYDTHASYASFVTRTIVELVLGALASGLMVTLVLPGGEPLYREAQPDKLRLYKAFTLRGIRSKEVFCASVIGLSMAAAHIGFIVLFYMVGSRLGVWAPQDLNYSDAVNTAIPWIAGVAIGVMAATSEEFLFRLFGVHFLKKITGSRVLSILLPAFFWSFLHSNYPQEPGYIRGIEVGLIGIVAGMVMLRWGIVATLTWHYTVDASLVGMLLIRSDNLYFRVSGIVVGLAGLIPLAYSGICYLTRGQFEAVTDLLNGAEPVGEIDLARRATTTEIVDKTGAKQYDALGIGTVGFLVLCLVVGGVAGWKLKREHLGDYLRLSVDARSAVTTANEVMKNHGVDPGGYRSVATLVNTTNPVTNEYLRRRMPVAAINKIYAEKVPGVLWRVRYFRESQAEEYAVILRPDGSLHSFRHILAEEAAAPTVTKEEAQAIAERFLTEQKKIDLQVWKLVDATSDKKPHRTDHTLTWQENEPLDDAKVNEPADHAYERMDVQVLGDQAVNYRTYIKIPEEFERKQEAQNLPRTVFAIVKGILLFGAAVTVLVFFFLRLKKQPVHVPWRKLLLAGVAGTLAFAINFLVGRYMPPLLEGYRTALPLKTYFATIAVGAFLLGIFILGGLTLLYGLAWSFAARAYGEERLPSWLGMPSSYYRDAFAIAVGGGAIWIAVRQVLDYLLARIPAYQRYLPLNLPEIFDARYPAAAAICDAILGGLVLTGIIALVSSFLGAELRARWLRLALFCGAAAAMVSDWGSPLDFVKQLAVAAVLLFVLVFGIRQVARFNLLSWFLAVAALALVNGAIELLRQPDHFYRSQGIAVMGALVLLLAWPLITWRGRQDSRPAEGSSANLAQ